MSAQVSVCIHVVDALYLLYGIFRACVRSERSCMWICRDTGIMVASGGMSGGQDDIFPCALRLPSRVDRGNTGI